MDKLYPFTILALTAFSIVCLIRMNFTWINYGAVLSTMGFSALTGYAVGYINAIERK